MADEKKATRRPPFLDLIRLFYIIPALQMLIFTASELQIRKNGMLFAITSTTVPAAILEESPWR